MFDLIKALVAGFSGKLKNHPEARKLVFPLAVTAFFAICCICFISYVSYSRYLDLAGFLPAAKLVAISFTVGIALFMFYSSSHITGYAVESWYFGESKYAYHGVVIMFVCAVLVGIVDYKMNIDGAEDVARNASGSVSLVDAGAIQNRYADQLQDNRNKLNSLLAGELGGYGWKDGGGVYHLNNSGKNFQRTLSANIESINKRIDSEIESERQRFTAESVQVDTRRATTYDRLKKAVQGVYFLQFLLCLVMSWCALKIHEALEESGAMKPAAFVQYGHAQTPVQYGHAQTPESSEDYLRQVREQMARLEAKLDGNKGYASSGKIGFDTGYSKRPDGATIDGKDGAHDNRAYEKLKHITTSQDGYEITCSNCNKVAIMKSPKALYCSQSCRKEAYNKRNPDNKLRV